MHSAAIEHLNEYIRRTCNGRLILDPNYTKSFEVYSATDFSGDWYKLNASNDISI